MFDITPKKTTVGVINFAGVTFTALLSNALIKPDCSATPTPSIATKTIPSGA